MNNDLHDLEYNHKQGVFHWSFKDEGVKPQWVKIAKSVPLNILIEFHETIEKQYSDSLKKYGKFMFSVIEARSVFIDFKKRNCPKERPTIVNLVGYNSFSDNFKNFS